MEEENKELLEVKLRQPTILKSLELDAQGGLVVNFGNGEKFTIRDHHDQECCESVYADIDTVLLYKDQLVGKKFNSVTIKGVYEMGFLLCFNLKDDFGDGVKVFIPCYNIQNGYYSDQLELIIVVNDVEQKIDISGLAESGDY